MFIIKKRNFACVLLVVFLAGAAVSLAAARIAGVAVSGIGGLTQMNAEYAAYKDHFGKLIALDTYIKTNYYLPVEDDVLETGAYKGMFSSLGDRYTVYYTPEEFRRQSESTRGEFSGIGAVLRKDENGDVVIESILPGSSAEKEDLRPGDILLLIDGKSYRDVDLTAAAENLRGEEGSQVQVRARRDGTEFDVTLTRTMVITPSVGATVLEDSNIGYIQIASFANQTAEDFGAELREMERKNVKGLVIDLRDNAGGLVERGVEIADMLLDAGTVATVRTNDGTEQPYTTEAGATSLPYVLLVNGGTASTSEILAGAVQDNHGGYLVGEQTTGKGILQRLEQFTDGAGARITVAQYYTPDGHQVHEKGIRPDFVVERSEEDAADLQLAKAIALLQE
ncbi:MAG: S41 family peptidase [Clostridiales Family XIII bacterium]|jgi:carboxyl-terminal processing protease|nr:S41 family peptidase [Clostridiales Family XIII bacterium]